jgi:hypothetical protein
MEGGLVPNVAASEPLGHKELDGLPDQFFGRVAQEGLRMFVGVCDPPARVDQQYPVGSAVHNGREEHRVHPTPLFVPGRIYPSVT